MRDGPSGPDPSRGMQTLSDASLAADTPNIGNDHFYNVKNKRQAAVFSL